ncbi:peptidase MA family metallohydrolase [Lysinibacillus xylanilyticus]|uniref:peptidase MA family metallohydrolase n=1 Tax=Lysinibacillus xylanilyticus TaxID=582475 RepID=UPI0038286FE9
MIKFRGYLLILVLLLTACSQEQDTVVPKEQEKSDENIVVTPDGKITFEIINRLEVPQEKVESIKDEILTAYDDIQNSIHTDYVPSERINVFLNEGYGMSWGLASKIELYGVKEDQYPLVHEMTHSLLGYGENFKKSSGYGYFTQEGFASYMENKYGKGDSNSHLFVKSFIDSNKLIPISKLIDPTQDDTYFRPDPTSQTGATLMSMSYIHSASFIKYLIDTYGLEKFEKLYNKKNVAKKIEEVYGKNISEIESDWVGFIKNSQEPTKKEKIKMMNYSVLSSSLIDQIDPKYFTKE